MVATKVEIDVAKLKDKVAQMDKVLNGDGTTENPGLNTTFQVFMGLWHKREEDKKKYDDRIQAFILAIFVALLGLLSTVIYEKVHGHSALNASQTITQTAQYSNVRK